jgi:hypothetical protein
MINARNKEYYSVFQGELEYQLCFEIEFMVLWQSAKIVQNSAEIPMQLIFVTTDLVHPEFEGDRRF